MSELSSAAIANEITSGALLHHLATALGALFLLRALCNALIWLYLHFVAGNNLSKYGGQRKILILLHHGDDFDLLNSSITLFLQIKAGGP